MKIKKLSAGYDPWIASIDKNTFISAFMPCPNGRRKFDKLRPGHSYGFINSEDLCLHRYDYSNISNNRCNRIAIEYLSP